MQDQQHLADRPACYTHCPLSAMYFLAYTSKSIFYISMFKLKQLILFMYSVLHLTAPVIFFEEIAAMYQEANLCSNSRKKRAW